MALLVLVAVATAFHDALAAAVIRSVAAAAGYNVRFTRLQVGFTAASATGTNVTNRTGEPVFSAGQIDLRYSVRDLLPGSGQRRFGVSALDVARPTLTLIHHADGTYNVALPLNPSSIKPEGTPLNLRLRVRDGSIVLLDRFVVPGQERRQRIIGLAADAVLAPHAHSFYRVRFDLDDGHHTLHPVFGKATFAADRGFNAQRWTAADIPIGPLVDFALPSHAVNVVAGDLHNVDGRVYTFVDPSGTTDTHMALRADLVRGTIYITGLTKPLRDAHGTAIAYDNGLTTNALDATLSGVPLRLTGGVYDFSSPKLDFALTGGGQLAQLQQAIAASQRQPVTGRLSFAAKILGSLDDPSVRGAFSAPAIRYRGLPVDGTGGTFLIHGHDLDLPDAHLAYGPVSLGVTGTLTLEKAVRTNLELTLNDARPLNGLRYSGLAHVAGTPNQLAAAAAVFTTARDGRPRIDGSLRADTNGAAMDVQAQVGIANGTVTVQGALGTGGDILATTSALAMPDGGTVRAIARVRGTLGAPRANVALLFDRARWRGVDLSGDAFAHYEGGKVHVSDARLLALGSYATATGDVRGLEGSAPSVDVTANVHGAEIATLANALHVPLKYPEGEIDADLHATGRLNAPHVAGSVRIPNGSLNGLYFSGANVDIDGTTGGIAARNGTVTVGSTTIAFSGAGGPAGGAIAVHAPHANLADFNDYFDAADMLGGHGHIDATAGLSSSGVTTGGNVLIADARYRRFNAGTVTATWHTNGRTIQGTGSARTDHGTLELTSSATLAATDPLGDVRRRTTIAASGTFAGIDLAQWLPAVGITEPILGLVSGAVHVSGTPAAPAFALTAAASNALVHGYPLSTLTLAVSGTAGEARLDALHVAGPGLNVDASGSFGYGPRDPVAIALHAQSDDLTLLAQRLRAKLDVGGAVTTTVNVSGTRDAPQLAQTLDATNLRSGKYTVPRVHVQLAADPQTLRLQAFDATLTRGSLLATATLPIQLTAPAGLRNAPLAATLRAEGVDLAQFDPLLPSAAKLNGTLNGQIAANGKQNSTAITGTLALTGLGSGAINGTLGATFDDARDPQRTLAFNGSFTAQHAVLDVANLFQGTVDGTLDVNKVQSGVPLLSGTLAFSKTRLSPAALILHPPANQPTPVLPAVAFNLNIDADNDVRVQGPGINVGARGAIAIGGNLAHPQLNGRITSTDGTLSFFRTFVIHQGTVAFHPSDGFIPDVNATATTTITDPDTSILLHVTGPATHLNLDLASSPSYDREQILGLLVNAQAFGAVPGVATSGGNFSASSLAGGALSQAFTQNLLQPFGSKVGQSLGFGDLALGYDFGTGVTADTRKQLGKNAYATFNQSFGADERQSLALNYDLPHNGGVALAFFNAGNQAPSLIRTQQLFAPIDPTNYTLQVLQPPPGIAGLALTYQKKFP
ncbi:MAG TPA: translocation/assembly module TamB domain-containing protein [Candidatus Lustribacter sp.]|nr:translocation/assembly module TamB domain-containing protein [Candidatus Lustribacter sp.]